MIRPFADEEKCIGCGASRVCSVRPEVTAIREIEDKRKKSIIPSPETCDLDIHESSLNGGRQIECTAVRVRLMRKQYSCP